MVWPMTNTSAVTRRGRRPGLLVVGAIGALATVATLTTGCGSDDTRAGSSTSSTTSGVTTALTGTSWTLATYSVVGTQTPAVAGAESTLDFGAESALAGSTGCNRFTGSWKAGPAESALSVVIGPMTQMACTSAELTSQEQAVLANLEAVATVTMQGDTLTLTGAQGPDLLTYSAVSKELPGTSWTASGVNNGRGGVETNAVTPTLTASFAEGGMLTGFGGCNNFRADYTTRASKITISAPASTKVSCGAEVDETERQYLAALQNSSTFEVSGNTLNLRDNLGATQVNFTPAQ